MNLDKELTSPRSMIQTLAVVDWIGQDPDRFGRLVKAYLGANSRTTQNAAYFMMKAFDAHPQLVTPHLGQLIENLKTDPPVAIRRNTIRMLQSQEIPEEYHGELAERCFKYLQDHKEAIAVKAFSMTVVSNLTDIYPDLKNELKIVIKDLMQNGSPGIKSRGRKVLRHLESIK